MLNQLAAIHDVKYEPSARLERIGDHSPMTAPPYRFGTHDGGAVFERNLLQPFQRCGELGRFHEVSIGAERDIAPDSVAGCGIRPATTAEFGKGQVTDAAGIQCA